MEINRVIIDTDILIDLLRNKTKTVNSLTKMETKGYSLATTTINAFELFYGAYKSKKREKNLASTKTLLKRIIILTMELGSAQNAGRIYTELEKQGQPIGLRDVMIGAIALAKGYSLATRNTEHFQKIKELNLIPIP
ncbi:type II toxin-antitoxin system VapC family toxin [Candidatus Bathyarchaeota archaeon]|nr:type II toxin-antitoxin system VapC family toxin [Candidatus Bathyarchaeota archaeon]